MSNKDIYDTFDFSETYKKKIISLFKKHCTIENGGDKIFDGTYNDLLHIPEELTELIFFLKRYEKTKNLKIKSFLEIGFSHGIFNTIINKFFKLENNIAVDCLGAHINGRVLTANLRFKNLVLFCSSSDEKKTLNHIKNICKFDLIFIDANHEYEYVKKDFENYKQFIKKRGLIIFHDINLKKSGSKKFWNEIKKIYKNNKEIIINKQKFTYGYGIIKF